MMAYARVMFEEREPRTFSSWEAVPMVFRSALSRIHQQQGHALHSDQLVRHLRAGGAGDADEQVSSDTTEDEESAEEVEVEKASRAVSKEGGEYPEMPPGGRRIGS